MPWTRLGWGRLGPRNFEPRGLLVVGAESSGPVGLHFLRLNRVPAPHVMAKLLR